MKPFRDSAIACATAAVAGSALASSGSLVDFKPAVMPVVVQVNAQGQVTDILPSEQLTPQWQRLLIKQLDAWIVKPAVWKGRPVASRFIIEVAVQANPRKDGSYDAQFVYVKSLPLAFGGALHWDIINGGLEVALVSDLGANPYHRQVFDTVDRSRRGYGSPTHGNQRATEAVQRRDPRTIQPCARLRCRPR